jgi:hypothetical protein
MSIIVVTPEEKEQEGQCQRRRERDRAARGCYSVSRALPSPAYTRYGAKCVQEHICQQYTKTRKEAMTATRNWKEERATQRRDRHCSTQHRRPSTLKIQTTSIPGGIKPMAQTTNSPSIFNASLLRVHECMHVSISACICVPARV